MDYAFFGLTFTAPLAHHATALHGEHNFLLVGVSYLIAVIAAFAAINVSHSISRSDKQLARHGWLSAGTASLGAGIWSMHFIGMMSFDINLPIQYDPTITALSALPALVAAAITLSITSKASVSYKQLTLAGIICGLGIGAMHYAGMSAISTNADMVFEPVMFMVSIFVAVILAVIALAVPRYLASQSPVHSDLIPTKVRLLGASIMGIAITAMHYTGMAAVRFLPNNMPPAGEHVDTMLLAAASAIITAILIAVAIFATMIDRVFKQEREHNKQFQAIVSLSSDIIVIVKNGLIVFANPAARTTLDALDLVGRPIAEFISIEYALLFDGDDCALEDMALSGDTLPLVLRSSTHKPLDAELSVRHITHNYEECYFLELKDVTALKDNARQILEREGQLNAIMNGAGDAIITLMPNGNIETINKAAEEIFLCSAARMKKSNFLHFVGGNIDTIENGTHEITAMRTDGSEFPAELSISHIRTDHGPRLVAIMRDISARKAAEAEIARLASTDLVTGLPNRVELTHHINRLAQEGSERQGAVMFVSLNGHQRINDTFGHITTEKLLRAAGARLTEEFGEEYFIGNWGGGDFLLVLANIVKHPKIERIANAIHDAMKVPFYIAGNTINLDCSIGTANFPTDGVDATHLVRGAGLAMFRGRGKGVWPYAPYHEEIDQAMAEAHQLEADLACALENNELEVYYQPKIDLDSGVVQGMEALVRWIHPTRGMVSPVTFIPVAEKTGMIIPIGEWVLRTACFDTQQWAAKGYDLKVAVNISGRQFEDNTLIDVIERALDDSGLATCHLELEITESALMDDIDKGMQVLHEIRDKGITVAIDDFGTGYSSLSYLKKLPLDTLKIDQSFVRDITTDVDDAAIATTIVGMASCLNLKVVAEGIETEAHESFLRDLSCEIGQGYLYSRPLPATDFEAFLNQKINTDTDNVFKRNVG